MLGRCSLEEGWVKGIKQMLQRSEATVLSIIPGSSWSKPHGIDGTYFGGHPLGCAGRRQLAVPKWLPS